MPNRATHDSWVKRKALESAGIEIKRPAVRLHGPNETPKHLVLKALLARELLRNDIPYDTEVRVEGGRIDVLSLGEPDEPPTAFEIESNCTPKRAKDKVEQYAVSPIRDVMILDPTDAPNTVGEIPGWLREQVAGI